MFHVFGRLKIYFDQNECFLSRANRRGGRGQDLSSQTILPGSFPDRAGSYYWSRLSYQDFGGQWGQDQGKVRLLSRFDKCQKEIGVNSDALSYYQIYLFRHFLIVLAYLIKFAITLKRERERIKSDSSLQSVMFSIAYT